MVQLIVLTCPVAFLPGQTLRIETENGRVVSLEGPEGEPISYAVMVTTDDA